MIYIAINYKIYSSTVQEVGEIPRTHSGPFVLVSESL